MLDTGPPMRPPRLVRGDTIGLVAPASVPDAASVDRARQRLKGLGYRVRVMGELFREDGYLAGRDEDRASALQQAFEDEAIRVILPVRGGYGLTRLLPLLDFSRITGPPKIVCGFSDLTILHLAVMHRLNWVSFHSPNARDGWGTSDGPHSVEERSWMQAVGAEPAAESPTHWFDSRSAPEIHPLAPGVARGRLVGGNLAVLAGLVGTPFAAPLAGRVLFLEDIGEEPYRIDRYLSQLALSGGLSQVAAILLGYFTQCDPAPDKPSLELRRVFADYFGHLGVPVLAGLPCGHQRPNLTLPLNVLAEVDANAAQVRLLEPTTAS